MTQLRLDTYTMPAAHFGPVNPLPPLTDFVNVGSAVAAHDDPAPADYPDRGQEYNPLPYRLQDDYDRTRRPRQFTTAVLENDFLRATFLLDLGGRLWSLVHKPSGRELLHVNPVFQPANLALRDAWFSGGVEWNVGIISHSPLTCSPLFAARVLADDGKTPFLRLYEFERIRCLPFQLDFHLPDASPVLLVRARLISPHDHALPMYWWSNIAVDERPGVRVLSPADHALSHENGGQLVEQDLPLRDGLDISYPTNHQGAASLFFQVPPHRRPYIAALDADGRGLFQASTRFLPGRKLWAWGMSQGSRHWQEYLAEPGRGYIEIQAGIATTQLQYVTMPAGQQWTWLEAYGLLQADPKTVHGPWSAATQAVEQSIEEITPLKWMDAELQRTAAAADRPPQEILHRGSGWGALERRRRAKAGEKPLTPPGIVFADDSLTDLQQPWLELLDHGRLPPRDPADDPGAYMVQPPWRKLLEDSLHAGQSNHWLAWLHLGLMRWRAQNPNGAKAAWEESLRRQPTAWSLRNLAVLARLDANPARSADLYLQAVQHQPGCRQLAVECCAALLGAGRCQDVLKLVASLPESIRSFWRIPMLAAKASLELGDMDAVQRFLASDVEVINVREAEVSLTDLWFAFHEKRLAAAQSGVVDDALRQRIRRECPPPRRLDFRMKT